MYNVVPYVLSEENQRIYDMLSEIEKMLTADQADRNSKLHWYVLSLMHALGTYNDVKKAAACMIVLDTELSLRQRLEQSKFQPKSEVKTKLLGVVDAIHNEYKLKYRS
jgi:hypothetical protein